MKHVLAVLGGLAAVIGVQCAAWAQVAGDSGQVVITTGSAISIGAVLALGTLITSIVGPWLVLRVHVATIEERCRAMCNTLDRHEKQIQKLNDRRDAHDHSLE